MTETIRLAVGLDLQSYVLIFCIVVVGVALCIFLFVSILYYSQKISEKKNKVHQDKSKTTKKAVTKQTMTLDEMNEKLAILQPEGTLEKTITLLGQIIPDFQRYLKTRPYSQAEANDYYYVYLQILNLCINIIPLKSKVDYKSFVKEYQDELQLINKRFREIASYGWLKEMDVCLFEIYRFITQNQTEMIDLRTVQYLLNNNQDLIIDHVDDKTFYHLSKKDYNQFGVELRGEYFEKNYFTEKRVFYKKKDESEFYY